MCDEIKYLDDDQLDCDRPGVGHTWHYDDAYEIAWHDGPLTLDEEAS